jgi:hypothetical protein
MANSKLLREAIADAKAVRETAIANAKIALEEAFTPQLQSILSRKLQAEMEDEEDTEDVVDEPVDAVDDDEVSVDDLGNGDGETENEDDVDFDGEETEPEEDIDLDDDEDEVTENEDDDGVFADPTNADDAELTIDEDETEFEDDDDLDLESIIRELEAEVDDEESEEADEEELEPLDDDDEVLEIDDSTFEDDDDDDELELEIDDEIDIDQEEDEVNLDDEIDLDEILREMGYGDEDDEETETEPEEPEMDDTKVSDLEGELEEAYTTIKSLKSTINEVNLLNAKLLYANRLFRTYNLSNEQKTKVIENLDRTSSVREVKLVYATLAESMNFTGTERKAKRNISEGLSSKKVVSTRPSKEIISENTDDMANRFKQLAGIIKS